MKEMLKNRKRENYFPKGEWEQRGVTLPPQDVINRMNEDVNNFIDFLMDNADSEETTLIKKIQSWLNDWDDFDFDTEEAEFIIDKMFNVMIEVNIRHESLII